MTVHWVNENEKQKETRMKLSDSIAGPEYVKALILGESGAGKTVGACTFPGKKQVMDFDGKISSAAKFYAGNKEVLESIEFNPYGKMTVKGGDGNKPRMRAFLDDLQVYFNMQNKKQKLPFDTIIIDTITTMTDSIMEDYRYVSQTGVKRPNIDQNSQSDYGLLATHFKQILTGCLALDAHVVVLGHTMLSKDESTGVVSNEILMPGQMSSKLGIYFEEVYFAKVNDKKERVWQTQADNKTRFCRTQRNLPPEITANFAEIVKVR